MKAGAQFLISRNETSQTSGRSDRLVLGVGAACSSAGWTVWHVSLLCRSMHSTWPVWRLQGRRRISCPLMWGCRRIPQVMAMKPPPSPNPQPSASSPLFFSSSLLLPPLVGLWSLRSTLSSPQCCLEDLPALSLRTIFVNESVCVCFFPLLWEPSINVVPIKSLLHIWLVEFVWSQDLFASSVGRMAQQTLFLPSHAVVLLMVL